MKLTLALVIVAVLLTGSANSQTAKVFSTKMYSIDYPVDWRLDSTKHMAAAILFFSPPDSATDKFDENVNIVEQNLAGQKIDLNGYKEISDNQMARMGEDSKILKSAVEKTVTGEQYAFECLVNVGGNNLHVKSICRIKNDIAYLVSFTTAADAFEHFSAVGNQMLESFRLK